MQESTVEVLSRYRRCRERRLGELVDWLRVPSISAEAARHADVLRAADLLSVRLAEIGAKVSYLAGATAPAVVGDIEGSHEGEVVLIYGHYDVQPPGAGWSSPPFQPTCRGRRLYARGTNDDKGQVYAWIAAVGAWCRLGGPRCRVVFLIDGEEEVGSPGLSGVLEALSRRVRPTLIIISDTEAGPGGIPAVTISQRGMLSLRVRSEVHGTPVHAGRFGGAVIDPTEPLLGFLVMVRDILARMPLAGTAPVPSHRLCPVPDAEIVNAAGSRPATGVGLARKIGEQAAMSVVDLRVGPRTRAGNRASPLPTAIPTSAEALVDVRIPPTARPSTVVDRVLRPALEAVGEGGVAVELIGVAAGHQLLPPARLVRELDRAGRDTFGRPTGFVRSGGSIPALGMFSTCFDVSPALLGLAAPFSGAHGPDEYLDIRMWHHTVEFLIRLLGGPMAGLPGAPARSKPVAQHRSPFESPIGDRTGGVRAWAR